MSVDNLTSIRDIQRPGSYLGKGMFWPPQEDPGTGDFKRAENEESIQVCVRHILETYVNQYPVLRNVGSRLEELLFEEGSGAVLESISASVKETLTRSEKRVNFVNVAFKVENNNKGTRTVFVDIKYRVIATGRIETNVLQIDPEEGSVI